MTIAELPNFRKLIGKIPGGLKEGTYYLKVENNYDLTAFSGHKYFVASNINLLGGNAFALSIIYCSIGTFCLIGGFVFTAAYTIKLKQQNLMEQ